MRSEGGAIEDDVLPTDCIAYVEATDQEALATTIIALRGVKGVASTDTRITVPGV